MKWISKKTRKYEENHLSNWHKWFAWYPVPINEFPDGKIKEIWLENVWRKGKFYSSAYGSVWEWEFKEIGYAVEDLEIDTVSK